MKKKGFTLVELLAVIVILAIIALIATPMIMDVIDKAKKGAVEQSALGYLDGIEKYSLYSIIDSDSTKLSSGIYYVDKTKVPTGVTNPNEIPKLEYKGETPSEGWVVIGTKGEVEGAYLKYDSYANWVGYTTEKNAKATLTADTFKDVDVSDAKKAMEELEKVM